MTNYISIDIESNGPIPAVNSMLSLGAAAFNDKGSLIGTFSENLIELPGAVENPDTMRWWATQPDAWAACRKDPKDPKQTMDLFSKWVTDIDKQPVCIAYPAGFDFTWVYWYLIKFTGFSPFSFSCLDLKSFGAARLNRPFRTVNKRVLTKKWPVSSKHTHVAVEDAVEQGILAMKMLGILNK